MKHPLLSRTFLAFALTLALVPFPAGDARASETAEAHVHALPEAGNFVLRDVGGHIACDEPTASELEFVLAGADERDLMVITPSSKDENGLTIVLRGTSQLDGFPAARQGFIDAAAKWQQLIGSPITVIIDVDFGTTRFGEPYPDGVLGSTSSQIVGGTNNYAAVRGAMVSKASGEEAGLMNSLPSSSVPTEIGAASTVYAPSPIFRAIGLLAAVANPSAEINLGAVPKIGFNSRFSWDFDPSNGIDPDKFDFDATAVHEIGHALGFVSLVGYRELQSSFPLSVSTWDLFRFRPGVTSSSFSSAQRVLSSGGSHTFYGGGTSLNLSTGRPDGSGGDQQQASHWKTRFSNPGGYIGIMDPTGSPGDRDQITQADISAIDRMGYALRAVGVPAVQNLSAALDGDALTVMGTIADSDANVTSGQASLLDPSGAVLTTTAPFQVNVNGQTSFDFAYQFNGMRGYPSAVRVRLTFTDARGNTSAAVEADFTAGDPGAASITSASYKAAKRALTIKGSGFGAGAQVEINGVILTGVTVKVKNSGVIKIKGTTEQLGLRSGQNSVRVRMSSLRSNIVIFGV